MDKRSPQVPHSLFWWRFDRYELRDGFIGPARGARLERYDFWKEVASREADREDSPVHLLMRVLDGVHLDKRRKQERTRVRAAPSVVDWCAQFGLLGVLVHQAQVVALPALRRRSDRQNPTSTVYVRSPRGWRRGAVLAENGSSYGHSPSGYAVTRRVGDVISRVEPLSTSVAPFFPGVKRTSRASTQYPSPLSDGFWKTYAEPVQDFLLAAYELRDARQHMACSVEDGIDADDIERRQSLGLHRLNGLAADVSPVLTKVDGRYEQRWIAPSLLGALAMVTIEDFAGRTPLRCAWCGLIFTTTGKRSVYCSQRCAQARAKAEFRKRQALTKAADPGPPENKGSGR